MSSVRVYVVPASITVGISVSEISASCPIPLKISPASTTGGSISPVACTDTGIPVISNAITRSRLRTRFAFLLFFIFFLLYIFFLTEHFLFHRTQFPMKQKKVSLHTGKETLSIFTMKFYPAHLFYTNKTPSTRKSISLMADFLT